MIGTASKNRLRNHPLNDDRIAAMVPDTEKTEAGGPQDAMRCGNTMEFDVRHVGICTAV